MSKTAPRKFLGHDDGFSTLFLLSFLPLLMTLLWGLELAFAYSQLRLIPLQICRIQNLKIQEDEKSALQEILKMNSMVSALRAEKISAEMALTAAVAAQNPPAISAASQWLQKIKTSQMALHLSQTALFSQLNLKTRLEQNKLTSMIKEKIKDFSEQLRFLIEIKLQSVVTSRLHLAVKPDRASDDPAIYEPVRNFSEQQSSSAFWNTDVRIQQHHWLAQVFPVQSHWRQSCGASLFSEHQEWKEKLWDDREMARLFSNPSSWSSHLPSSY